MDRTKLINTNNLTLLNWNANGIASGKRLDFEEFLHRHQVDVACVSETHLLCQDRFKVKGFKTYRRDSLTRATGGVAICVRTPLPHSASPSHNLTKLECVSIETTTTCNTRLRIAAAYLPPRSVPLLEDFTQVFSAPTTILLGDLNSKNTVWNCRKNNGNGRKLERIVDQLGIIVSAPSEPTFYPYQELYRPDILDVCLLHNIGTPITQEPLAELDSDHVPVLLSFTAKLRPPKPLQKLINGKVDWTIFQADLDSLLIIPSHYYSKQDIDTAVANFSASIIHSVKTAVHEENKNSGHFRNRPATPKHIAIGL